ncbi:MAG: GSCFA domain-containing protein [Bacteroidia bacterium]
MNFRTEITIPPLRSAIDYESRLLSIGSCFADRIGQRMAEKKFSVVINPLGIIYNPVSLCRSLQMAVENESEPKFLFAPHLHSWHSFHLHSRFNHPEKEVFETQVKQAFDTTGEQLRRASHLILTFGTAWVYREKSSGEIVANCHKYPANQFTKDLLSPAAVTDAFYQFLRVLLQVNPGIKILLTVSPVRHTKEGLSLNAVSKATLRLVCHQLTQAFENIYYFPAYEIMTDDLRDYRFYGDDLIHPSQFAESYIWEKFTQSALSLQAKETLHTLEKIQREMAHRPMNSHSPEYRHFLEGLASKLNLLHTTLDCTEEIRKIRTRLETLTDLP